MEPSTIKIPRICLVGAGNLSWHLSKVFSLAKIPVVKVINRNIAVAGEVAKLSNAEFGNNFSDIPENANVIFICLSDTAIESILPQLKIPEGAILIHTAGSINIDILKLFAQNYGVFYPFQTFTKGVDLNFSSIPILIEGNTTDTLKTLEVIGKKISDVVKTVNSDDRKKYHLAGVMANNFTNHLLAKAGDYLQLNSLDKSIILPLVQETVNKLNFISATEAQTGPARRKNHETIANHLQMLSNQTELKNLYKLISDSILAYYS